MSKKFKSQASSSRAAAGGVSAFGGFSSAFGGHGKEPSSLTYVTEPPDLTVISDQHLVISFKNFQKKDDITRSKALDDVREFVGGVAARQETLDDGFLEAWVKVYPRASIDLSRRVRQTAHSVQASVAGLVGKRIVRHMPRVIGAWLAGIYDNDRLVARAALESFTRVFSTEEKRSNVWKIYQSSILDFVDDVILQQTPLTLSDERTVKPDDAEAKYSRVVGAAISLFNRVLGSSANEILQKDAATIETLLGSKSLWSFCFHEDPCVRRSLYALLRSAVSEEPAHLNWKIISSALIGKSLSIVQTGSATELSDCLLEVTTSRPQLWTEDYSAKSSSSKRLIQYVKKGSQGASSTFWPNLNQLLRVLPQQILANVAAESNSAENGVSGGALSNILDAYLDGINSREEPRHNLGAAWKSFAEVTVWLSTQLPTDDRGFLITSNLCPLFERHITASQDQSRWALPVQASETILSDTFVLLIHHGYQKELRELWSHICAKLVEAVKLSAPEQSKDFKASQDAICAQANRLFSMEAVMIRRTSDTDYEETALGTFEKSNPSLIEGCLQVLRSRNGKPYGAAAVVEEAIFNVPEISRRSTELVNFLQHDAPMLLLSPSADRLVATILACRQWEGLETTSETMVDQILQMQPEPSNKNVLEKLLSSLNFEEVSDATRLNSLVLDALDKACRGSELHWPVVVSVLHNPTSHGGLADAIFLSIIEALSTDSTIVAAMQGLFQIASSELSALQRFQSGPHGSKLTGKLLFLAESPEEELAFHAETLLARLRGVIAGELRAKSNLEVLRHGFTVVNDESLSIESLVKIAEDLLDLPQSDDLGRTASEVLPSPEAWEKAMRPFLNCPLPRSKAITSTLRGITQLIDSQPSEKLLKELEAVPRDSERHSSAFRLASFAVQLLSARRLVDFIHSDELRSLFYNLPLAIQLIEDDLRIQNCNGITGLQLPDQRDDLMEVVVNGRQLIRDWANSRTPRRDGGDETISSRLELFWQERLESVQGASSLDYRIGEAFVEIMRAMSPLTVTSPEQITKLCRECRTSNAIRTSSWFAVLRSRILEVPTGVRLCNELIADGTDIRPQDERSDGKYLQVSAMRSNTADVEGLRKLALLNMLLSYDKNEDVISSIPTQRVVFFTKNLVGCLESEKVLGGLKAEIFESLSLLLPRLGEIYGSHWESVMRSLSDTWKAFDGHEETLPTIAASFRLFARLVSMTEGESNDDLVDAWSQHKSDMCIEAVSILLNFDSTTVLHEPRDLTVELCCSISGESVDKLENVGEFFSLLTVNSSVVQKAGFEVLHQFIPKSQEKISFDVALSKTAVNLPDELISLLLEPPTIDIFSATLSESAAWMSVRAYLLSWKVVFDHFSNASLAVQEYYASNLKQNETFTPLLEFTFDFLQKSHGKLVDATNMDIRHFELDRSDSRERETEWLLVHLYLLSLKYLPNMTKNWWLDTKKRIKGPVETWTEKHISPLIIEDALQNVSDWESTQDRTEERALSLKTSLKAAEIIASIPVDEESPPVAISITLPSAYPLQPALVTGRSRVLVDERKWKSWLLTIQGVIMFANGNLVDGLLAFRRNVQGALKGQSECAICYSVISTDMQTPNKRCATCKNTFHSVCLFRWFKSSNQSTCPLCRNNFVYI